MSRLPAVASMHVTAAKMEEEETKERGDGIRSCSESCVCKPLVKNGICEFIRLKEAYLSKGSNFVTRSLR